MQLTVKMSLKGKTSRKWANGQNIYDSENKIDLRGSTVPALGLYTCMILYNSHASLLVYISGLR